MEQKFPKLNYDSNNYKPNYRQKYEYRVQDYQRPYKDYAGKEETINKFAQQGWELITTSVIKMGISDDLRIVNWYCSRCGMVVTQKTGDSPPVKCSKCSNEDLMMSINKKVWCIEHLYFRRELIEKGEG